MASDERTRAALADMLALMDCLRDPVDGCPWDLKQDFASIAPHTLEEVYEVVDAIERGDHAQLKSELGDLLFQIVFYARLGKEAGLFDFADIAAGITAKLLHRHPHVFPDATLESFRRGKTTTADGVVTKWEDIKAAERAQAGQGAPVSALDDVPLALPALQRAAKLQKRAANVGFDWHQAAEVLAKADEETAELREALAQGDRAAIADEFGDLLFTMVNLGRHLKVEPEQALRNANAKFERRFRSMEVLAAADGLTLAGLDESGLENYWQRVKREEQGAA